MQLFALSESRPFAERVATELGLGLSEIEERVFPDGEFQNRPLVSLRGRDVYVIQSLHAGPDVSLSDKLVRLLVLLATLRDNGAQRVTAVIPYLAFARQDRQVHPRDPLALRTLALLLEAAGADAVVTVDVHNIAAFQNAFRCQAINLEAAPDLVRKGIEIGVGDPVAIVSPDLGGAKRAQRFGESLKSIRGESVSLAYVEKQRLDGELEGTQFAGDVQGAHVLIVDDMISTGSTIVRAAKACRERGASRIHAFATHGLFSGNAADKLMQAGLEKIVVSNSVPPFRLSGTPAEQLLDIVDVAPLFATAIRRLHENKPLSESDRN
jgi:ribose-phosphate pyrophosphokinase